MKMSFHVINQIKQISGELFNHLLEFNNHDKMLVKIPD